MATVMMWYSVEAGIFIFGDGNLVFEKPDLKIPLVDYTLVGRSKYPREDMFCTGGTIDNIEGDNILPMCASFPERAAYDGSKIIFPTSRFVKRISRDHGAFIFEGITVNYRNLTDRTTHMCVEGQIRSSVAGKGEDLDLQWPKQNRKAERFLIFGGGPGETLEDMFGEKGIKFYLRITREHPDSNYD